MKYFFSIFIMFLVTQIVFSQQSVQELKWPNLHNDWNSMLQTFVKNSRVDYKGFKTSEAKLNSYLKKMHKISIVGFKNVSNEEQLAFYINLYNAYTVRLILDHPEVASIRDIRRPWKRKIVKLAKQKKSLNDIEHKIVRKYFKEPRIHFALVCESIGCPALQPFAFVGDQLDSQLTLSTKEFLADESKNQFTDPESNISKIFSWYSSDFGKLKDFLSLYAPEQFNFEASIDYLSYDWNLNSL